MNEIKTISRAMTLYDQQGDEISEELRSQLQISGDSAVDLLTSPISAASNLAGQLAGNLNTTLAGEDAFIHQPNKNNQLTEEKKKLVQRMNFQKLKKAKR